MTLPESHLEFLSRPGVGVLSTIAPDGAIQTTALWFLLVDGELKFSLSAERKKTRNLIDDPRATFFLLDPENPFHFIEIRGTVTLDDDPEFAFRTRVGDHYGSDLSQMDQPGDTRYAVTLHPTTVNAQ